MAEIYLYRGIWHKVTAPSMDAGSVRIVSENRNVTRLMVYYRDINSPSVVRIMDFTAAALCGTAKMPDNTIINMPGHIRPQWIRSDWLGDDSDDPNHFVRDIDYGLKVVRTR